MRGLPPVLVSLLVAVLGTCGACSSDDDPTRRGGTSDAAAGATGRDSGLLAPGRDGTALVRLGNLPPFTFVGQGGESDVCDTLGPTTQASLPLLDDGGSPVGEPYRLDAVLLAPDTDESLVADNQPVVTLEIPGYGRFVADAPGLPAEVGFASGSLTFTAEDGSTIDGTVQISCS